MSAKVFLINKLFNLQCIIFLTKNVDLLKKKRRKRKDIGFVHVSPHVSSNLEKEP